MTTTGAHDIGRAVLNTHAKTQLQGSATPRALHAVFESA